jgi:Histidine kinase-, DNA gyrase B-, and HSP90-like ATPase
MADEMYKMTISLNVLSHLGINLYSNIPAVLSEVVANSWDADATVVDITVKEAEIIIEDNGCGMSFDDINNKYLHVGYERRNQPLEAVTPIHHRPVMGRKGIGKLSMFSIATTIEIQTMRDGIKNGFIMSADKIKTLLKETGNNADYHPDPLPTNQLTIAKQGTRLTIRELKKGTDTTEGALRKRLARRFGIIGAENAFIVNINGKSIGIDDRDYFHKLQYLWYYGENSKKFVSYCKAEKLKQNEMRPSKLAEGANYEVSGWIGSVEKSGDLKDGQDNLNKIVIMVRGKLAQEDILEDFVEGGMYTKYLMGEIHADFLDTDDVEADSATTSRQEIKKDDPRYIALKDWVLTELKNIQSLWTNLRNEEGTTWALQVPAINQWFSGLGSDNVKHAKKLFGKLNQLVLDSDEDRRTLLSHAVLAFENFRFKENLDAFDNISIDNVEALAQIFANQDDIEATLYHQITKGRLAVINKLKDQVNNINLEKEIQKHLYEHLWLLDPSWERGTETPWMEQNVAIEWGKLNVKLDDEERKGRVDIKYKNPSGKHVIIELKKADIVLSTYKIMEQVDKYRTALTKILQSAGRGNEPVEVVCLVGKNLADWTNPDEENKSRRSLAEKSIRVVMYQQLIEDAYNAYKSYLEKRADTGRITTLIQSIEEHEWDKI